MESIDSLENSVVLVIDDEKETCILLAAIIHKNRLKAAYVHTLEDAVKSISKVTPVLIFLDINLPDGNGIDFLTHLSIHHPEIHVVIISAFDSYKAKAEELGAYAFLIKPFSKEAVMDILSTSVNHA
jgi:two-component SAPR family response regulator